MWWGLLSWASIKEAASTWCDPIQQGQECKNNRITSAKLITWISHPIITSQQGATCMGKSPVIVGTGFFLKKCGSMIGCVKGVKTIDYLITINPYFQLQFSTILTSFECVCLWNRFCSLISCCIFPSWKLSWWKSVRKRNMNKLDSATCPHYQPYFLTGYTCSKTVTCAVFVHDMATHVTTLCRKLYFCIGKSLCEVTFARTFPSLVNNIILQYVLQIAFFQKNE